MKTIKEAFCMKTPGALNLKQKIRQFYIRFKQLQGDPHHIARGIGIGVFVGITPTIPFHTIIALAMSFILRASKPAAALGVWLSNPFTAPFFYLGSYKVGMFLHGNATPFDPKYGSILELLKLGMDVTVPMIIGGVIIGFLPGIAAYFITLKAVTVIRSRNIALKP